MVTAEVTIPIVVYVRARWCRVIPTSRCRQGAGPTATTWGKAVSSFTVAHLIGQTVSMLGDGSVFAPQVVPGGGVITTQFPVLVLTVGLATITQIETFNIENSQTLTSKQILIVELCAMFYLARGGSYGQDFAHLKAWNQRLIDLAAAMPTALYTAPPSSRSKGRGREDLDNSRVHRARRPADSIDPDPVGFVGN